MRPTFLVLKTNWTMLFKNNLKIYINNISSKDFKHDKEIAFFWAQYWTIVATCILNVFWIIKELKMAVLNRLFE